MRRLLTHDCIYQLIEYIKVIFFAAINDTLEVLDLSWNHIRRMGALAICKGLQVYNSNNYY